MESSTRSISTGEIVERESGPATAYDPLADIEQRLANPPKHWTPRGVPEGMDEDHCILTAAVAGIVQSITDAEDEFGGHRLVVIRRKDGSRVQIAGFGVILKDLFNRIQIGDAVGLEYEGEVTPKTPGYKDYPSYRIEWVPADPKTQPTHPDDAKGAP